MSRKATALAGLAAVLLAAGGWHLARQRALAAQGIPPTPPVPANRADLLDEIAAGEKVARAWLHPQAGLVRLSRLYHANGYYEAALQCYDHLRVLDPREARWPHLEASILAEFGRLDEAPPLRQRAVALAPDYLPGRLRLGDVLLKANRIPEARAAYTEALALESGNGYALLGLARCALAGKDWSGARDHLREAVRQHPDFVGALSLLATVAEHFGDQAEAAAARAALNGREFTDLPDAWLDALADDCFDAYRLSVAAAVASASGDLTRADQLLSRAIALAPEAGPFRRQYAQLLGRMNNAAEARRQLEQAVTVTPDDADSWLLLVQNLTAAGDAAGAEQVLRRGLAACPRSPSLHLERARLLNRAARADEAIAEYRESYRLRPSEAAPLIELATVYYANQRVAEAKAALLEALQKLPDQPVALATLCLIAIGEDDAASAQDWWRRLRSVPNAPERMLAAVRQAYAQRFGRPLD